ncbi:MAG: LptF/LptG family permease [Saprospiraceae bacterium]|nr:LptF/LptG family permease [Saprospiraceae bacterium]
MKKLDSYIIRKFISAFFFVALLFTLISVVVDFSDKVEEFIDEPVTVYQVLVSYYFNFTLWINGLLWPLYVLIAVIFFTSRMAYNSEIISILGAGVSFRRMMVPYMGAALLLMGIHFVGNHFIIPKGNKSKLEFERAYIWQESDRGKVEHVNMFIGPNDKIYVRYFRKKDSTAVDFQIDHFERNKLVAIVKAKTAIWQGYPNNWKLKNYEIRTFDGMDETLVVGANEPLDTMFNLTPEDFVKYNNQKEMMTTPELRTYIKEEAQRGVNNTLVYQIEIDRRTADPFTILILTLIGVAIASRKVRGGMGLHLAIGIALGAIYIFLSRFSITFATSEAIPPLLGVWLPNIVFGVIAIYLLARAQK